MKPKILTAIMSIPILLNSIYVQRPFLKASSAEKIIVGDANSDGLIDAADASAVLAHYAAISTGNTPILNELQAAAADVDNDGKIDAADASFILNYYSYASTFNGFLLTLSEYIYDLANNIPHVRINEICASNSSCLIASDGSSPDWVELYNFSSEDIDMSGMGLSDGKKNRYKFIFPDGCIIPAGGSILVMCDGKNVTSGDELHASFNLSAQGETVYLTMPDSGKDISVVTFPAIDTDITYGRFKSGSDEYDFLTPTPNEPNDTANRIVNIEEPIFSSDGGFYDSAFELTLSDTYGNTILYTIDGSDPQTSPTAAEYTEPITIYDNTSEPNILSAYENVSWLEGISAPNEPVDKGIVVRAVCVDGDGNYSKSVTNSYFIGKTAGFYNSLRVMSISTDADNLFDDSKGIFVNSNYYGEGKEWERPCNIQVFENGVPVYSEDVGIRIAGNWSRAYPQKSLTLYARGEYGSSKMRYDFFNGEATDMNGASITEFKKVTLRNGGDAYDDVRFRDDLNAYLAKGLDMSVQAKNDYIVFIDGEFWGYYSMQEKLEDNYIEAHYHIDTDNVTTVKNGEYEGDEAVYQDYADFFEWAVNADMTDSANYGKFCEKIDVQSLIDFIITESYICNWDSLVNVNNTMLWRANETDDSNPYADGKWRFMLYDTEYSAGFNGMEYTYNYIANMDNSGEIGSMGSLFYNLINNDEFSAQFIKSYEAAITTNFSTDRASARIDYYLDRLSEAYTATEKRFGYDSGFEEKAESIRKFFDNRAEYALEQCKNLLGK